MVVVAVRSQKLVQTVVVVGRVMFCLFLSVSSFAGSGSFSGSSEAVVRFEYILYS